MIASTMKYAFIPRHNSNGRQAHMPLKLWYGDSLHPPPPKKKKNK